MWWNYNYFTPVVLTYLCGIEGWAASPLKHVFIDIPIISSKDWIQIPVVEVKGIHQSHSVEPQLRQQLLDTNGNLQHLRHTQQSSLKKKDGDKMLCLQSKHEVFESFNLKLNW